LVSCNPHCCSEPLHGLLRLRGKGAVSTCGSMAWRCSGVVAMAVGQHSESKLGQQSEFILGQQSESTLGQQSESTLEQPSQSKLGQQSESKLGQQSN